MDWFDRHDVQRTLKSLLQHHNLKASFLWCSAFFTVQLSHPYLTTRKKNIASTIQTLVCKGMSDNIQLFLCRLFSSSKHYFPPGISLTINYKNSKVTVRLYMEICRRDVGVTNQVLRRACFGLLRASERSTEALTNKIGTDRCSYGLHLN